MPNNPRVFCDHRPSSALTKRVAYANCHERDSRNYSRSKCKSYSPADGTTTRHGVTAPGNDDNENVTRVQAARVRDTPGATYGRHGTGRVEVVVTVPSTHVCPSRNCCRSTLSSRTRVASSGASMAENTNAPTAKNNT